MTSDNPSRVDARGSRAENIGFAIGVLKGITMSPTEFRIEAVLDAIERLRTTEEREASGAARVADRYDWREAVQDALLTHLAKVPAADLPLVREYIAEIVELEHERRFLLGVQVHEDKDDGAGDHRDAPGASAPPLPVGDEPTPQVSTGLVYLASPYSDPDLAVVEARFDAVCHEAAIWMGRGVHIYSPIAHTHPIAMRGSLPTDWAFWQTYDRVMIDASAEVWVLALPGWRESKGVTAEIAIAEAAGKKWRMIVPETFSENTPVTDGQSARRSASARAGDPVRPPEPSLEGDADVQQR